jgi:riboflavin kinase/FMN adenylyltransferase
VESILADALGVRSMHEGANFRFGHRAQAGVAELAEFGREFGFTVTVHPPVHVHGLAVSSTAIRQFIAAGDMKRARWMLGRTFSVRSTPAKGRGIGTRLLVPTVNLAPYSGLLPTFGEASFAVESYILDFEPVELTEETPLELEFLLRLRPEIQWPSPEALKAQIMKDVGRAKRFFRLLAG